MKYLPLLALLISGCSYFHHKPRHTYSPPAPIEQPTRELISPPQNMRCFAEISSHGIAMKENVPTAIKDFGTYFIAVAADQDLFNIPMVSGTLKKDGSDDFYSKKDDMSFFVYPSDGLYLVFYKQNGQVRRLRVQCL